MLKPLPAARFVESFPCHCNVAERAPRGRPGLGRRHSLGNQPVLFEPDMRLDFSAKIAIRASAKPHGLLLHAGIFRRQDPGHGGGDTLPLLLLGRELLFSCWTEAVEPRLAVVSAG